MYWLNPIKYIEAMRRRRNYPKQVTYLGIAAILIGLSASLGYNAIGSFSTLMPQTGYISVGAAGVSVAIVTFIAGLFFSWLFSLGMSMLGGHGDFYEGLASISYPLSIFSVGIFIAALASYAGVLGWIISFLALTTCGMLSYTALFRATKEMFRVDMLTAFIGVSALFAVMIFALYGSTMVGVLSSGFLPQILQPSV